MIIHYPTARDALDDMKRIANEMMAGIGYPMTPVRFKCICNALEDVLSRGGNMVKIREALEAVLRAAREIQEKSGEADTADVATSIVEICERALLFPPRNCDVGTIDEQIARLNAMCASHLEPDCANCPVVGTKSCVLAFAQLPYTDAPQEGGDRADA